MSIGAFRCDRVPHGSWGLIQPLPPFGKLSTRPRPTHMSCPLMPSIAVGAKSLYLSGGVLFLQCT